MSELALPTHHIPSFLLHEYFNKFWQGMLVSISSSVFLLPGFATSKTGNEGSKKIHVTKLQQNKGMFVVLCELEGP
jgi:hypothetical protein